MRRLLAGMLLALLPSLALGQAATIANGACRLDGVDCGVTGTGATAGVRYGSYTDSSNYDVITVGYEPNYWVDFGIFRGKVTGGVAQGTDLTIGTMTATVIDFLTSGSHRFRIDGSLAILSTGSTGVYGWSATTPAAALDTSLSRVSAGIVGVGTGAAGSVAGALAAADLYAVSGGRVLTTSLSFSNGGPWGSGSSYDLVLTRRAAATLQLGAADSATPVAQTIAFQGSRGGTDTNVAGVAATIQGSLGTGTGGGGDVLVRTAPKGSTGTTQNTPTDRLVLAAKQVTLTDSTATTVLNVSVASGTVSGGTLWYTIRADDATDFQSLRGRVMWAAVNKGGTVTCGITTPEEVSLTSAGTLTNTVTCVANGNSIDLKLAAISSLTETTLYAYVSTQMDGTGTVTTQ